MYPLAESYEGSNNRSRLNTRTNRVCFMASFEIRVLYSEMR